MTARKGSRRTYVEVEKAIAAAVRRCHEGVFTQAELAKAIGSTQATVSRWARGDGVPSVVDICRVEDACERPRGFILRDAGLVAEPIDVATAIDADPSLPDELRGPLKAAYLAMVQN